MSQSLSLSLSLSGERGCISKWLIFTENNRLNGIIALFACLFVCFKNQVKNARTYIARGYKKSIYDNDIMFPILQFLS